MSTVLLKEVYKRKRIKRIKTTLALEHGRNQALELNIVMFSLKK